MLVMILGACSDDGNDSNKNDNVNESSENTQQENTNNAPNNNEDTVSEDPLDDVVAHFENDGFEIGEKTEKVAEMVGATDGFGIALDGTDIELYLRSEERRVGKECRSRWSRDEEKKKWDNDTTAREQ